MEGDYSFLALASSTAVAAIIGFAIARCTEGRSLCRSRILASPAVRAAAENVGRAAVEAVRAANNGAPITIAQVETAAERLATADPALQAAAQAAIAGGAVATSVVEPVAGAGAAGGGSAASAANAAAAAAAAEAEAEARHQKFLAERTVEINRTSLSDNPYTSFLRKTGKKLPRKGRKNTRNSRSSRKSRKSHSSRKSRNSRR